MKFYIKDNVFFLLGLLLFPNIVLCQSAKPNIVWITIEDTSPDFIGCYGNSQVKTPNIDALAKEGIKFTNAFSTNTVCSPSRHTIITGVRTAQDGCGNHRSQFKIPSFITGFPFVLKAAGYFTSNNSKTDYNIDNPKAFVKQNWTEQGGKANFNLRTNKSQPFFSVFNFNESHQSRTVGNSKAWYEKEILSKLSADEIIKPDELEVPPFYKNNANNRKNIARLYNCLKVTDNEVGRIIKMIKDAGEWDNTIVFFFSDHGQGMPRFKTNASRLGSQVPFIIRFPEKYKNLLPQKAGTSINELVTFEDLAPTTISIATQEKKPAYMTGRIFLGNQKQATDNVFWGTRDNTDEVIDLGRTIIKDDFVYTRIYQPHLPVLQQQAYYNRSDMLQEMRNDFMNNELDSLQASIFKPRSAEYLFNRKNDRWETVNLAKDKKHATVLAAMRTLNQQKIKTYADLGFLPEVVIAQINVTDTLLVWKQKNYNINKYVEVAEMVGMGKQFITTQTGLLNNKDSVIRYWAVIGLRNQQTIHLNKAALIAAYVKETSAMVKIELADLLFAHFKEPNVLNDLAQLIATSQNEYIVRHAAMRLANIDNLPESIINQIKKIKPIVSATFKSTGLSYPINAALGTVLKINVVDDAN
jgi:arylsulfatase A-like enzyme